MAMPRDDPHVAGWVAAACTRLGALWPAKFFGITGGMTLFFVAYFWVLNNPMFPVTTMPLTAVDRAFAFRPESLALYFSLWVYVSLAPALIVVRRELFSYGVAAAGLAGAGLAVFRLPAGVDDAEGQLPIAFQSDRQRGEEVEDLVTFAAAHQGLRHAPAAMLEWFGLVEEPRQFGLHLSAVAGPEGVEVVVAQNALGLALVDAVANPLDYAGTVRPTVAEVADEDQPPPLGMIAAPVVAQSSQQNHQRLDLAVNVAHHVDGSVEQFADQ
jgi:hypothetical protein